MKNQELEEKLKRYGEKKDPYTYVFIFRIRRRRKMKSFHLYREMPYIPSESDLSVVSACLLGIVGLILMAEFEIYGLILTLLLAILIKMIERRKNGEKSE